jgi:hypothetical protein
LLWYARGAALNHLLSHAPSQHPKRISILIYIHTRPSSQVGLDAAGKTTILYKLRLGEVITTIPTIGEAHCLVYRRTLHVAVTAPVLNPSPPVHRLIHTCKGFNVDTIAYKNLNMTVWDIGGQTKIRPLWRYYYEDTNAIIYVVDSSDPDRFAESREELHGMLQDVGRHSWPPRVQMRLLVSHHMRLCLVSGHVARCALAGFR